ncbi:hypothetical protein OPKNFCMD_2555 [Methylobacterium crusticola]|uniref:M23ase beta-sheet core domain-containing protein n=1 Tax=Methylobacterium crusticola TaxID=1697972 RepID=A0ABQ4QYU5_9HYPH|nr:M23 family metallopeptidase [Methylobacterium crusticola]GJD49821.1 hypothetical protein OPKNFCMD_2555 [Methylobacterium crusticola]
MPLTRLTTMPAARLRSLLAPPVPGAVWVVRRRTLALGGLAYAALALWASAATWFIVFHDQALAQFMERQSAQQYAYEERISALRVRLDRVATQKLLEQDGVENRIADLASRQVTLENRHAMLAGLSEQAGDGAGLPGADYGTAPILAPLTGPLPGIGGPVAEPRIAGEPKPVPVPSPTPESLGLRTDAGDGALTPAETGSRPSGPGATLRVAGLERALDGIEARQSLALDQILVRGRAEAARLRVAVAEIGLDAGRFLPARAGGVGGPLVPVGDGPFESAVIQAQRNLGELGLLRRVVRALPLRRPTVIDAGLSSTFGYRVDPFTRGLALHTGVDLKAEYGAPARAAAAGTVVSAEYSGGYGNMVEIDHGHGLATRYGHLSGFAVVPGQAVAAGQVVGRVGSTGRSTGPHLHYETRIDGEPVDPQRFLRAGTRLLAAR